MKYSPDAYLLHESNRFITFNIRIKVVMKDMVKPDALRKAAEKAFCRFPYYSKQIHIDDDGGIDLIPNPRTISVSPVSSKRTYLFSEEVNYQPCSIEYEDNCIYFNMYHGICGGCGTFLWVKTTVYEYICANYGVHPEPGTTIMADTPVSEEEYAFPKLEGLPDDTPLGKLKKDEVWFPGLEYLLLNDPPKMVYRSTENHESVYVRYSESGNLYEEKYLSKEYSYSSMDGEVYGLASDLLSFTSEHTFYTYYDGEYIRSLLISPDGLSDDKYHMLKDAGFALEEGTLQETIQSVKKKDGRIIVTSFESPEAIEASEMGGLVSYNAEYVLDAKTHELISVKDVIEYDDGTVYNVGVDFIYDAEIPEGMKAFVEYEQQTEDLRTITIVSNPGTESEKSESVQIPKGLSVALEPDFIFELDFSTNPEIEEVFELYSDAACTQLFDLSEDDDSDITIYVKWCQ